jgi:hypothetical protein
MHGIAQQKAILNTTIPKAVFNVRGNIDECPPRWFFKPEFLEKMFHKQLTPSIKQVIYKQIVLRFLLLYRFKESKDLLNIPLKKIELKVPIGQTAAKIFKNFLAEFLSDNLFL